MAILDKKNEWREKELSKVSKDVEDLVKNEGNNGNYLDGTYDKVKNREIQQTMTVDQAIDYINNVTDQELEKLIYEADRKTQTNYNKTTQAIQVLLNNFLDNPEQDRRFVEKSLNSDGKFDPKTRTALRAFEILCGNELLSEHSNLNTVKLLIRLAKHKDIKSYYDELLKNKESYTNDELEELVAYGNIFNYGVLMFRSIKNLSSSQAKILSKISSPRRKTGVLYLGDLENLNTETAKALSSRYVEELHIYSVEIKEDVAQVLWKGSIKNLWIKKPKDGTSPLTKYWWKEVDSNEASIHLERVDNNQTNTTLNNQPKIYSENGNQELGNSTDNQYEMTDLFKPEIDPRKIWKFEGWEFVLNAQEEVDDKGKYINISWNKYYENAENWPFYYVSKTETGDYFCMWEEGKWEIFYEPTWRIAKYDLEVRKWYIYRGNGDKYEWDINNLIPEGKWTFTFRNWNIFEWNLENGRMTKWTFKTNSEEYQVEGWPYSSLKIVTEWDNYGEYIDGVYGDVLNSTDNQYEMTDLFKPEIDPRKIWKFEGWEFVLNAQEEVDDKGKYINISWNKYYENAENWPFYYVSKTETGDYFCMWEEGKWEIFYEPTWRIAKYDLEVRKWYIYRGNGDKYEWDINIDKGYVMEGKWTLTFRNWNIFEWDFEDGAMTKWTFKTNSGEYQVEKWPFVSLRITSEWDNYGKYIDGYYGDIINLAA